MSKYKSLGKNTVLVFVGNIGSKVIGIVMLPLYTTWLSVGDYGTFDLILVYVNFLIGIVTLSISSSIFIFPRNQKFNNQKEYFSSGIFLTGIGLVVTALIFVVLKLPFFGLLPTNIFTHYTWTIFALITVSFMQLYTQQFARALNKVTIYAFSGIILTASIAGFSFLLIPKYKIDGYIFAQILSLMVTAVFTFISTKSYSYFSISSVRIARIKEMLTYSIPLIPNALMWWLVSAMNRPMLENYWGTNSLGIFAVANKFPTLVAMVFTIFGYSWQISVMEEFNKPNYKEFYNKILRLLFTGLFLLSCFMAIFSKLIVKTMVDEKFFEAWKFIPILTIAVIFSSLSGFVGTNFSATKESKYYFYSSVWGAGASLLFNFLLIPKYGLYGAVYSFLIAQIILAISRVKYSWIHVKIVNLQNYIVMFLINCGIVGAVLYVNNLTIKIGMISVLMLFFVIINISLLKDCILMLKKIKTKLLIK